ncbi:MAG TPA: hypothetical protein VMI09_15905 [Candidatus Binataceae bacterium]|nr:hypothetical protein [Candidatus Binataceae bacterium]
MKGNRLLAVALAIVIVGGVVAAGAQRAFAQSSSSGAMKLWVDQSTGQVFVRPGKGRVPLSITTEDANAIEQQVEQKVQANTNAQIKAQVEQSAAQLQEQNQALATQVAQMQPAWKSYMDDFHDKFRLGAVFYGDYRFYTNTGFQPQEMTQLTNPGPGNNDYNSFDVTRTYLNFFFFPTKDWELRLTPNMYKTIGSSNDKVGQTTGFGSNLDGNLGVRMKYAVLTYNGLLNSIPMLKGGVVMLGEQPNPLVDWEEQLYGFRYVNLTPWNYLSLSSTQVGVGMAGPVKFGEKTYFDYAFGAYDNSSFHAFEQSDTKQAMVRGTVYPFGAKWRFDGLGFTGFYNYGYGNTAPDTADLPTALKGGDAQIQRLAALVHYTAYNWGIAGEYDWGRNAFQASNLWSGSGPADAFGFPTGKPITSGTFAGNSCGDGKTTTIVGGKPTVLNPCYPLFNTYGPQASAQTAILNNGQADQQGFDFFGHFHIPQTPLTLFGMFQWFMPNTNFATNPLDFQRWIFGLSYQYNEYVRFAIDSQNISYYHNQQTIPISVLKPLGYSPGGTFNGWTLPKTGAIPEMVQRDTHSIFANVEFSY